MLIPIPNGQGGVLATVLGKGNGIDVLKGGSGMGVATLLEGGSGVGVDSNLVMDKGISDESLSVEGRGEECGVNGEGEVERSEGGEMERSGNVEGVQGVEGGEGGEVERSSVEGGEGGEGGEVEMVDVENGQEDSQDGQNVQNMLSSLVYSLGLNELETKQIISLWHNRTVVPPLDPAHLSRELDKRNQLFVEEHRHFELQSRKALLRQQQVIEGGGIDCWYIWPLHILLF